jgi:hypothetical protein
MNDGSSVRRGRPWLRRAGAAAVTGLALLVAACGGGSSAAPPAVGSQGLSAITTQALAYAKCMRSHGIPNFPDPTVHDNAQSQSVAFGMPSGVEAHSPQYLSAAKLCQKQTGFGHISPAQLQQGMNAMLKYAECMRSHGITNFPDPAENRQNISFNFTGTGLDQNSPQFKAANKACQTFLPGGGP